MAGVGNLSTRPRREVALGRSGIRLDVSPAMIVTRAWNRAMRKSMRGRSTVEDAMARTMAPRVMAMAVVLVR